jgi:hypothetical protein
MLQRQRVRIKRSVETQKRTDREYANGLAEVACLAVGPSCILQHSYQETELAEETMFSGTVGCYVGFGQLSDWMTEVHYLQERVGVGILNVRF